MSDSWTKRGWACVETCTEQGLPITASYIKEIVEQRAELLEALEGAKARISDMLEGDDGYAWKEARKSLPRIEATITKAKAVE